MSIAARETTFPCKFVGFEYPSRRIEGVEIVSVRRRRASMAVNAVSHPVRDATGIVAHYTLQPFNQRSTRNMPFLLRVRTRGPVSIDKHGHCRDIIVNVL